MPKRDRPHGALLSNAVSLLRVNPFEPDSTVRLRRPLDQAPESWVLSHGVPAPFYREVNQPIAMLLASMFEGVKAFFNFVEPGEDREVSNHENDDSMHIFLAFAMCLCANDRRAIMHVV